MIRPGDTITVLSPRPYDPAEEYDPEWPRVKLYDYIQITLTPELITQYGVKEKE